MEPISAALIYNNIPFEELSLSSSLVHILASSGKDCKSALSKQKSSVNAILSDKSLSLELKIIDAPRNVKNHLRKDQIKAYTTIADITTADSSIVQEDGKDRAIDNDDTMVVDYFHSSDLYSFNLYTLAQFYESGKDVSTAYELAETEYKTSAIIDCDDSYSETMDDQEAKETMQDICIAFVQGTQQDIDYTTRRRLVTWIMFNPALFKLYECEQLSRDVNYTAF